MYRFTWSPPSRKSGGRSVELDLHAAPGSVCSYSIADKSGVPTYDNWQSALSIVQRAVDYFHIGRQTAPYQVLYDEPYRNMEGDFS